MSIIFPTEKSAQSVLKTFGGVPRQRSFNVRTEVENPLMDMKGAQAILGKSPEQIEDMVHTTHEIAWAWDVGMGVRRDEVRILSKCVSGCHASNGKCGLEGERAETIIGRILAREPHPFVKGTRLRLLLVINDKLLKALLLAGELAVLPGTTWNRGPLGTACITRQSVINFFHNRRIQ